MLTDHQRKQLIKINEEFKHRNIELITQEMHNIIYVGARVEDSKWVVIAQSSEQDVKRFGITNSADYIHTKLNQAGIYGIAICSPQDSLCFEFGEFIAKARLLKHLQKIDNPHVGQMNLIVGKDEDGRNDMLAEIYRAIPKKVACVWSEHSSIEHKEGCLSSEMASAKGGVLLIEDIETRLHYSMMESMWDLLFNAAQKYEVTMFATTHSIDCVKSFSIIANKMPAVHGVLHRVGRSVRASNIGDRIVTTFNPNELCAAMQMGLEVR